MICHNISPWGIPPVIKRGTVMENELKKCDEAKDKELEMQQYFGGLTRYTEKGITIFMDGKPSGPEEWEKLFEVREDGMFYMGDYVQSENGGLKEIRFDKVYLCEKDLLKEKDRKKRKENKKDE